VGHPDLPASCDTEGAEQMVTDILIADAYLALPSFRSRTTSTKAEHGFTEKMTD